MPLAVDDLVEVATDLGVNADFALGDNDAVRDARARVEADIASPRASGVRFTPTFYINRRRYDGPWDESSLVDAMLGTLGHRVRTITPGSANPDGRRLVEDDFAAATAAFLNKLTWTGP
jgi:NhaA family Na+:H+ antiporter